jgi:hypothetical protein
MTIYNDNKSPGLALKVGALSTSVNFDLTGLHNLLHLF